MNRPPSAPLTREQVRAFDRRAIEQLGVPGIVLMENAGRAATDAIVTAFGGATAGLHLVTCGIGNNGGDGFVIARHLAVRGAAVHVLICGSPARLTADARTNHAIAERLGVPMTRIESAEHLAGADALFRRAAVIVDALLGTGATGPPRPPVDAVIRRINLARQARIAAVDIPSGLDCDTGLPADPTVRADLTITFVAPKIGYAEPAAAALLGTVLVADIGVPTA